MATSSQHHIVVRWCRPWVVALLMVAAVVVVPASAQGADADAASSTGTSSGSEFWLAFPTSFVEGGQPNLRLFIAGATAGSGTMEVPGLGFSTDFTVAPGEVTTVDVPVGAMLSGSDEVQDRGVHVVADTDLSVYGLNQQPFSTDAYLGLPVSVLGNEYVVLAYENTHIGQIGSEFAVLATQDETTVTITPSVTTSGHEAGVPYDVTLDAGEAYQLINRGADGDLSGSIITSDKPVAAFGGHECANTPPGTNYCDHIVQQLFPTAAWGSSYVTVPFVDRAGDTIRVVAATDGSIVEIDGEVVATLDRGEFHETILDGPAHITASNPVMVAQYMHGSSYDEGGFGDPSVVPIPSAEQFLPEYTVTTPATGFVSHAINLVVPDAAVGAVTIDGVPVDAEEYVAIGDSGFSGAQVSVAAGSKVLSGPMPFGATMYGTNDDDSYAYPGGLSLSSVALVHSVTAEPTSPTATLGSEACIPTSVRDAGGDPLPGIRVDYEVVGANPGTGFDFTDPAGDAEFCYTGTEAGEDTITSTVGPHSATTTVTWEEAVPDPDGLVQSFWLYGPVYTFDEEGERVDLLSDLLDAVADDLGSPVTLFDDVAFREAPVLAPQLVTEFGEIRDDVDVVAGVLTWPGSPGGGAILVVATPRVGGGSASPGGRHAVSSGDSLRLNLGVLGDRVASGDPIGAIPAYGETYPDPSEPPPEEDVDPVATLADRFTPDPDTDEVRASVASVPGPQGQPAVAAMPGQIGVASEDAGGGSMAVDLPAIDRMLEYFATQDVGTEVADSIVMTVLWDRLRMGPVGTVTGFATHIEAFLILHAATREAAAMLDHFLSGGSAEDWVPPGSASRGDPHHRTHAGTRYSFMAVGEFVAARTDGLEVQLRTTPVGDSGAVSLNELVAVRVGDDVVTVRAGASEVHINDEAVTFDELKDGHELATATVFHGAGVGVKITTDDGHVVRLSCGPRCGFVDVFVTPAELGAGGWEGLFGANEGDPSTDLRDRDGEAYPHPLSFEDIHGTLADDWRVTPEESLFPYGPGEDTETFTDRDFPSGPVTLDLFTDEERGFAEAVCRDAGLGDHDPITLDECMLDFIVTGDLCFVWSAQAMGVEFPEFVTGEGDGAVCEVSFVDVPDGHTHFAGICRLASDGIAVGYGDGTFRPQLNVSRGQLASLVVLALESAGFELPAASDQGFIDIGGTVHADAINQLVAADIVQGVERNRIFQPGAPVSRDQMATFLVSAAEWALDTEYTVEGGPHFTDTAGSVHERNIDVAFELGLTQGTGSGAFSPRGRTSRGQSATFLSSLLDTIEAAPVG